MKRISIMILLIFLCNCDDSKIGEGNFQPPYERAWQELEKENYEKAEKLFNKSKNKEDEVHEYYAGMAWMYFLQGEHVSMENIIDEADQEGHYTEDLRMVAALLYFEYGQLDDGLEELEVLLNLNSQYAFEHIDMVDFELISYLLAYYYFLNDDIYDCLRYIRYFNPFFQIDRNNGTYIFAISNELSRIYNEDFSDPLFGISLNSIIH